MLALALNGTALGLVLRLTDEEATADRTWHPPHAELTEPVEPVPRAGVEQPVVVSLPLTLGESAGGGLSLPDQAAAPGPGDVLPEPAEPSAAMTPLIRGEVQDPPPLAQPAAPPAAIPAAPRGIGLAASDRPTHAGTLDVASLAEAVSPDREEPWKASGTGQAVPPLAIQASVEALGRPFLEGGSDAQSAWKGDLLPDRPRPATATAGLAGDRRIVRSLYDRAPQSADSADGLADAPATSESSGSVVKLAAKAPAGRRDKAQRQKKRSPAPARVKKATGPAPTAAGASAAPSSSLSSR